MEYVIVVLRRNSFGEERGEFVGDIHVEIDIHKYE